jgi:alpha-ketoglutarate-dependent taurine dioxygenase
VAFYCRRAAFEGSQTTLCDGARLFDQFAEPEQRRWSQAMTVRRTLPEALWKRYLANEHPALSSPDEVRPEHLLQFQAAIPGQHFDLHDDGSLDYELDVPPVVRSRFSEAKAFANAILGPSHNYEPPTYRLADGAIITEGEIEALRDRAEGLTVEINWQDGDVAVIDNTRVMHGRRAIVDPERELFIGMGTV